MNLYKTSHTDELNLALAKAQHWQSEIYENAESALTRAKGLSDFLAHTANHVQKRDPIYPESLFALAESISNEIQAVQLMLQELSGFIVMEQNPQA